MYDISYKAGNEKVCLMHYLSTVDAEYQTAHVYSLISILDDSCLDNIKTFLSISDKTLASLYG